MGERVRFLLARVFQFVLLCAPFVIFGWMAFEQRWMNEDGFINLRIARNLLEGNGFVFNVGERVEAGTSPLWIFVVALLGAVGIRLEYAAVYGGLVFSMLGCVLAQVGAYWISLGPVQAEQSADLEGATIEEEPWHLVAREALRKGWWFPWGLGLFVVLPPAWDFASSGLETGLVLFWLGGGFAWLVYVARQVGRTRGMGPCALWLSLGPLVRPELALFSLLFLAVLAAGGMARETGGRLPRLRRLGILALWGGVVPIGFQIFRMGYFAALTPNTAFAKEAFLTRWGQGLVYAKNFFLTYHLSLPLFVVGLFGVALLVKLWRVRAWMLWGSVAAAALGGLLNIVYVVKVGGDFMHGRMFLPGMFGLLLPVAGVRIRWQVDLMGGWVHKVVLSAALVGWMVFCGTWLRVAKANKNWIGDERNWYVAWSRLPNPIALEDYRRFYFYTNGLRPRKAASASCPDGKLPDRYDPAHRCVRSVYVDTRYSSGKYAARLYRSGAALPKGAVMLAADGAVGIYGYLLPSSVYVLDRRGLADPLAARLRIDPRKRRRPGHEKVLPNAWIIARFTQPAPFESPRVNAARRALSCGDVPRLLQAVSAPLTIRRFFANLFLAFRFHHLRIPRKPLVAEQALCGSSKGLIRSATIGSKGGVPFVRGCPMGSLPTRFLLSFRAEPSAKKGNPKKPPRRRASPPRAPQRAPAKRGSLKPAPLARAVVRAVSVHPKSRVRRSEDRTPGRSKVSRRPKEAARKVPARLAVGARAVAKRRTLPPASLQKPEAAKKYALSSVRPKCGRYGWKAQDLLPKGRAFWGPTAGWYRGKGKWLQCPAGYLATGVYGHWGDGGSSIGGIGLHCKKYSRERRVLRAVKHEQSPVLGAKQGTRFSLQCPKGRAIVGFLGRAGWLIDALGIHCEPVPCVGCKRP